MTIKRRKYGQGHAYYADFGAVGLDGKPVLEKLPGVTTIIGDTVPKPALTGWAAGAAADHAIDYWDELAQLRLSERRKRLANAHRDDRDAAARRGTEVHRLAEQLNNDQDVVVPDELRGHVEAYRDFLDAVAPRPLLGGTELVVASRTHRYCGTADLVADLDAVAVDYQLLPPARWLLEIKTTRSGVWPESALQACAYKRADVFVAPDDPDTERPMDWLGIKHTGVVWVKSDAWELRPVDSGDEVWETFLHLRWLYDHQDARPSWIGQSAAPAPALAEAAP